MARIRSVKPEFFVDEKLTECSHTARLLFIGLLCFVDDQGVMVYSPKRTKALIFPADNIDVSPFIQELVDCGRVVVYEREHQHYLWVRHFTRHQKINRQSQWRAGPLPEESGELTEHSMRSGHGVGIGYGIGNGGGELQTPPPTTLLTDDSVTAQCVPYGTPENLHPLNYATRLLADLGMPHTPSNLHSVAAGVKVVIKEGKSPASAYEYLLAMAIQARDEGVDLDKFWFEDAKWRRGAMLVRGKLKASEGIGLGSTLAETPETVEMVERNREWDAKHAKKWA